MISMTTDSIINFQRCKPLALEIYQMARPPAPWDIGAMAARGDKKDLALASARMIASRFQELGMPDHFDSERQWLAEAGVSSSFFSNLRGSDKKPPSVPSVGNLRLVLEAAGWSLSEFFLPEAQERVIRPPDRQAVIAAVLDALDGMPQRKEQRAAYLATIFEELLQLPKTRPAKKPKRRIPSLDEPATAAPARAATRKT